MRWKYKVEIRWLAQTLLKMESNLHLNGVKFCSNYARICLKLDWNVLSHISLLNEQYDEIRLELGSNLA